MEGKVNVKYASPPIASAPSCRAPNIASPNAPNFSTEPRTKVPSQNLEQGPSTHTKYCANNHCKLQLLQPPMADARQTLVSYWKTSGKPNCGELPERVRYICETELAGCHRCESPEVESVTLLHHSSNIYEVMCSSYHSFPLPIYIFIHVYRSCHFLILSSASSCPRDKFTARL